MAHSLLSVLALASAIALAPLNAAEASRQDPPDRRCHIHGRLVDEAGAPIAGARVVAHGWSANQQRVAAHGLPEQWTDPEVRTADDGRFALRFVPPQAFQFTVEVEHDEYADLGWRWAQVAEGEERAQGDVTLVRPGVIEGYLQTPSGDLLVDQWSIQASLASRLPQHAGISTKHCAIDPATGAFRFADLPPGQVALQPTRRTGERAAEVVVTTTAGEVTQAILVYDGPDPARRILLRIASSGPAGAATSQLADGALRAIAADGSVHPFERVPNRAWEYWAKDLTPGEYRVEIDDPRFERWVQESVRSGESVRATLVGRAKLRANVLGPDGMPVQSYGLTLQQTAPFRTSQVIELQSAATTPPLDGIYGGLLEGSYEVRVTAAGFGEHRAAIEGVSADAPYELVVRLAPSRALRGRVVHADGGPVAGATLQITLGEVAGHDTPGAMMTATIDDERGSRHVTVPYRDASTVLDAEGQFELSNMSAAPAVLRVLCGDWIHHDVHVDLAKLDAPLVVTLPPLGSVIGRVSFDGERPPGELLVRPQGPDHLWRARADVNDSGQAGVVDGEGHFELGPLVTGAQVLELSAVKRHPEGRGGTAQTLARVRVDVAPGAPTRYDIDLGFEPPATRVAFTVTLGGDPPADSITAQLVPRDRFDATGREVPRAFAPVADGRCMFERVAAGMYDVVVSNSRLWAYNVVEPFELTADEVVTGEEQRATVDVPIVRRDLRVLTAEGAPYAASEVWIGSATQPFSGVVLTTSAEGMLALALPSGRYAATLAPRTPQG